MIRTSTVQFDSRASDPATLSEGLRWYRADLNEYRWYDGSKVRSANGNTKVDQASAPGVGDDIDDLHEVGDLWHRTSGAVYLCTDNSAGAAVWEQVASGTTMKTGEVLVAAIDNETPADTDTPLVGSVSFGTNMPSADYFVDVRVLGESGVGVDAENLAVGGFDFRLSTGFATTITKVIWKVESYDNP